MRKNIIISLLIVIVLGVFSGYILMKTCYVADPQADLEETLNAIIERDEEVLSNHLDYGTYEHIVSEQVYGPILKSFRYKILFCERTGDHDAVAAVEVSNRDFGTRYGEFISEAYQLILNNAGKPANLQVDEKVLRNQVDDMFQAYLLEDDDNRITKKVRVDLVRKDRHWHADITSETADAIAGGYFSASEKANEILSMNPEDIPSMIEQTFSGKLDMEDIEIREAIHYAADEVWNQCLRHMVSAINAGEDANGKDYDMAAGWDMLNERMEKMAAYTAFFKNITDPKHDDVKHNWEKMDQELNRLVEEMRKEDPKPMDFDYLPDTTGFEEALKQTISSIYKDEES